VASLEQGWQGLGVADGAQLPMVALLDEQWASLAGLGAELSSDEWDLPTECPGWTVRDLYSHMIGTERSMLGDPAPPPAPDFPHIHNPIGSENEAWVEARRGRSGHQVLEEFRHVTAMRLRQLEAMTAEELEADASSPIGVVPYREFLSVRVMDCWVHEQDARLSTGRPGHSQGPAAQLAFDRLVSAMPFVVAKQAAAPDGSSVRFELGGTPGRRIEVVVRAGRATAEAVARPTVVLRMDAEIFWRLACGRVDGDAARTAGLVGIEGDEALGRTVVRSMAFMI